MLSFLAKKHFVVVFLYTVFLLHILALIFGWYDNLKYFDSFHHFLGGAWVASLAAYYLVKFNLVKVFDFKSYFFVLIFLVGTATLMGVFWEIFEFGADQYSLHRFGISANMQPSLSDTMGDLFFDCFGALVFAFAYLKISKQDK